MDCLKYFTVVEHLDNYRCDQCWHIIAAKHLSLKSEVDEVNYVFLYVLIITALEILWHPCFVIKVWLCNVEYDNFIDNCYRKRLASFTPVSTMALAVAGICSPWRKCHVHHLHEQQSSWLSVSAQRYPKLKYSLRLAWTVINYITPPICSLLDSMHSFATCFSRSWWWAHQTSGKPAAICETWLLYHTI